MTEGDFRVLVVDDDQDVRDMLLRSMRQQGCEADKARNGRKALEMLGARNYDLVLLDLTMPDMDGYDVLEFMKASDSLRHVPVIVLSGGDETAGVVKSLTMGADDYIAKPFNPTILKARISSCHERKRLRDKAALYLKQIEEEKRRAQEELRNALAEVHALKEQVEAENIYLRKEIRMAGLHGNIIGQSDAMKSVLVQAEQVAVTESTVLILGETGTGKELLARAIHNMSARRERPLVVVNCAAMPSTLVESELFGREKEAYTGALTSQIGRFELANGSTVFLDEVGELPAETQVKLLRVLQERQFERLGSTKTTTVDVRVIAATNRNLEKAIEKGTLREDLYYRLNVFPITIPPLRERREDIPPLVWAFVSEFSAKMGKRIESVSRKSMEALQRNPWPGNIRELRNVIERAMILAPGGTLTVPVPKPRPGAIAKGMTLEEVEREHIVDVMERTGWRVSGKNGAAEILGLKPTTLESKLAKLGIIRPDRASR